MSASRLLAKKEDISRGSDQLSPDNSNAPGCAMCCTALGRILDLSHAPPEEVNVQAKANLRT
jgi:hypothetical protein